MSPVIPTMANLLLAALWAMSAFAGWGVEAFCATGEPAEACGRRLAAATAVSVGFAVVATVSGVGAWLVPAVRHDSERFTVTMAVAVVFWVGAVGVLFVGGVLAR